MVAMVSEVGQKNKEDLGGDCHGDTSPAAVAACPGA